MSAPQYYRVTWRTPLSSRALNRLQDAYAEALAAIDETAVLPSGPANNSVRRWPEAMEVVDDKR